MTNPEMGQERVELAIPASVEWLALARTTGAAIASRWAFTYDEIADLRLAIDELCLTLVEGGQALRLEIAYELEGDSISVTGHAREFDNTRPVQGGDGEIAGADHLLSTDLSARILDALVDEHGSEEDPSNGGRRAWLRKTRSSAIA